MHKYFLIDELYDLIDNNKDVVEFRRKSRPRLAA